MNSELVSIVMATYNGESFLHQQMDSILGQTYQHFELIVVDDASTDNTLAILNEYASLDDRIHIFPAEKNLGLVANFERGLGLVKSEYIALSDQDDIFRIDKIELLKEELAKRPDCDLVISDLSLIDEDSVEFNPSMWRHQKIQPQHGKPFQRLLCVNFATGCSMMFRRRMLNIALPFPPECLVHDWWLAVVAASSRGGGICLVYESLTAYRQHRDNVMGAKVVDRISTEKIISRIKTPPQGRSKFDDRINYFKEAYIARLKGYLWRDFWSLDERLVIAKIISTFEGYLNDDHSSLLSRLTKLPKRVSCAATTRSITRCLIAVYVTIWPMK
jgi:glycosyltransferase involved in cell wall biosynthesis